MKFNIPPFFRMLIMDDTIAAFPQHRESLRNIFTALVLEAAKEERHSLYDISIVFEGDPAKGFKRWHDEPFDLTLIDVDFSRNRGSAEDADDLTRYILNARDRGLHIFKLLDTQTEGSGPFTYRKKNGMCNFFLWSGLSNEELETQKSRSAVTIDSEYFLKKDKACLTVLQGKIECLVRKILQNNFTPSQKIERLLFALEQDYGSIYNNIAGGCLIADKKNEFPWLPTLAGPDANNLPIRICGAHLPDSLLNGESCPRFLPLANGKSFKAVDAIAWLLDNDEQKSIFKDCAALKARANNQREQRRLPWFSDRKKKPPVNKKISFIAAATPLTGISVIGRDNATVSLAQKTAALLCGPFDKVVLKTTYLDSMDQWENTEWPSVHIQSHMRSRCLYPDTGTPTLWNSGKTAMETLPPRHMNKLLKELVEQGRSTSEQVVVSLGSKFPMGAGMARKFRDYIVTSLEVIWQRLFDEVFCDIAYNSFPFVEINVRHFLREIVHYHLGGDEYLTPRVLNEKASSDPNSYWREFKLWLAVIHEVAVQHKKKLILKLPHRSDTLAYVECIVSLREHHLVSASDEDADYGVRGITVVNALKTPVPQPKEKDTAQSYSPAWYADPEGWGDARGKLYQMSGRLVGAYRNQILAGLLAGRKVLQDLGLEIWISGGVTSRDEVRHCLGLEKQAATRQDRLITGIQIGTWALLETELNDDGERSWYNGSRPAGPAEPDGQYVLDVNECKETCCEDIHESCPHKVLAPKQKGSKPVVLEEEECLHCTAWTCIENCKSNKLRKRIVNARKSSQDNEHNRQEEKSFLPRFSFLNIRKCQACGRCSRTFYCDTFIDRVNTTLPPLMDSRYCTGCGLCAQVCSSGALQLYPPEKFLVLLSSSSERKEILDVLGIPHLQYDPEKDQNNFPDWLKKLTSGIETDLKQLEQFWNERLEKDKYMLHQDEPELYPEKRMHFQDRCIKTGEMLSQKAKKDTIPDHGKETLRQACCWSQLIWSDPGQVLWDSFILSIHSIIKKDDGTILSRIAELKDSPFKVSSWIVLLRQGELLLNQEIISDEFKLAIHGQTVESYTTSGFGQNRAAELDVRACGEGLVQPVGAFRLTSDLKIELAGLPWKKIKKAVADLPEEKEGHKVAFTNLCDGVIE